MSRTPNRTDYFSLLASAIAIVAVGSLIASTPFQAPAQNLPQKQPCIGCEEVASSMIPIPVDPEARRKHEELLSIRKRLNDQATQANYEQFMENRFRTDKGLQYSALPQGSPDEQKLYDRVANELSSSAVPVERERLFGKVTAWDDAQSRPDPDVRISGWGGTVTSVIDTPSGLQATLQASPHYACRKLRDCFFGYSFVEEIWQESQPGQWNCRSVTRVEPNIDEIGEKFKLLKLRQVGEE